MTHLSKLSGILWLLLAPGLMAQDGFLIRGTVSGWSGASTAMVLNANDPVDTLAHAPVRDERFQLRGKLPEPGLVYLQISGTPARFLLFIGNEELEFAVDSSRPHQPLIRGSAIHADFLAFQERFAPLFDTLDSRTQELRRSGVLSEDHPLVQAYLRHLNLISEEVDQFTADRPQSPVTPFVLMVTGRMEPQYEVLQERYRRLPPHLQESYFGKIVLGLLKSREGQIGAPAKDFRQNDPDGNPVSLSSFRGKYVLVDFWASWCGPCRLENPNLVKAYQKFKDRNFTVLGVSLDNKKQAWLQAIKADKLVWTQVSDLKGWQNEAAALYGIRFIPQNFLVDPEGRVIAKNLRGEELHRQLESLLDP